MLVDNFASTNMNHASGTAGGTTRQGTLLKVRRIPYLASYWP